MLGLRIYGRAVMAVSPPMDALPGITITPLK